MDKTAIFIEKSKLVHGERYDYSPTIYEKVMKNVTICCRIHGNFLQTPNAHLCGKGCSACSNVFLREKFAHTKEKFIEKSQLQHGERYDYSPVEYVNQHVKVKIICKEHGEFEQTPMKHCRNVKPQGCSKCAHSKYSQTGKTSTAEEFIEKSKKIQTVEYDYSKVDYKNNRTHVIIICKEHGEFKQTPSHHLSGDRCPHCNRSKGEDLIGLYLRSLNIRFEIEKCFDDCKGNRKRLPFDFYLPDYEILIEYDGKQHFMEVAHFGGADGFEIRKKHDNIKTEWAKNNNKHLLRIRYDESILISLMIFLDPYLGV